MKRIVLTERDEEIIIFLEKYKCATTSTIARMFFNNSNRPTTRRLKYLREHGFINSSQEYVSLEMIHYLTKKPTQLQHSQISSKLISLLKENNIDILKSKVEFKCENVRSDLLIVCKVENKTRIFFIEVCNTKKFDCNKYVELYESEKWRNFFPIFPQIIVISNKPIEENKKLDIIKFNLNIDNFKL